MAVGHGKPLTGEGVPERLQALADAFDEVAVPDNIGERVKSIPRKL